MKKLATKINVVALGVFLLSANINPARAGGDLDPGFGNGGKVTTDLSDSSDTIDDLTIQPDGKIVAAGSAQDSSRVNDFALIRIDPGLPAPPPPPDFDLRFDSAEVNAQRGSKVTLSVNIIRTGGHSGAVTITPPDTAALKIKVKPPTPISASGTSAKFKLKIKGGAPVGSHEMTFTGKDESGKEHQATVRVVIQ